VTLRHRRFGATPAIKLAANRSQIAKNALSIPPPVDPGGVLVHHLIGASDEWT